MKYILIFIVLVGLGGCRWQEDNRLVEFKDGKATEQFIPHAVHNPCLDVWAVLTQQSGIAYAHCDLYFGKYSGELDDGLIKAPRGDSSEYAVLGNELQFKDSVTAMGIYNDFIYRRDRPLKIADSIFKCKHTYQ
jgi:hypothetical protein